MSCQARHQARVIGQSGCMEDRDGVAAWTVFETIWIQTFVQCLTVPRLIRLHDEQYPIGMFSSPTNIKRYLASLALSAV